MHFFVRTALFICLFNTFLSAADVQHSWFGHVRQAAVSLRMRVSDWALLKLSRGGHKKDDNPQPAPVQQEKKEIDAGRPWRVNGLKNIEAYHIRSSVRKGGACGWYALFNARAIQELLEKGHTVEESAIKQYVEDILVPWIESREGELLQRIERPVLFDGIKTKQMEILAMYLGLSNYHLINIYRQLDIPPMYYSSRQDKELEPFLELRPDFFRVVVNMAGLLRGIMQKGAAVQHIILNVPSSLDEEYHSVLISVIKRTNEKPFLFYMDSNNRTLDSCELGYIVPYYVLEFIRELDAALENVA